LKAWVGTPQRRRLIREHLRRNIDRDIGRDRERGIEQDANLAARPTTEFDQRCGVRQKLRNLMRMRLQNPDFRARRIIFGQLRDRLEQSGAFCIVEIFRRQALRPRREAGDDITRKGCCLGARVRAGHPDGNGHHELLSLKARAYEP